MVAIIGTLVGAQLFLAVELSHPYVGAVLTVPEPLQRVIRVLKDSPTWASNGGGGGCPFGCRTARLDQLATHLSPSVNV